MKKFAVMMYHALYANPNELAELDPEDRPYAVSVENFKAQLDLLARSGIRVISPQEVHQLERSNESTIMLTFDDGHKSFYRHAFPVLQERGLKACFFVTSDLIDKRKDFCDWTELAEMHRHGMAIQSHGKTHLFLNDMLDEQQKQELEISKSRIESKTGNKVFAISFPGGRYNQATIDLGHEAGYSQFYTSEFGLNKPPIEQTASLLRRIPLRQTTTTKQFGKFAFGDSMTIFRHKMFTQLKTQVKKVLGNNLYHELYKRVAR